MKYDWLRDGEESPPEPPDDPFVEYVEDLREGPEALDRRLQDGEYGPERLMEAFGEALDSGDPGARRVALEGFRRLTEVEPEVVGQDSDVFVQFLDDSNPWVVREAVAVVEAMADVEPDAFRSETGRIAAFAAPEVDPEIRVRALGAIASIVRSSPSFYTYADSQVEAAVDDAYPEVRAAGLRALAAAVDGGQVDAGECVDRFTEALESGYAGERGAGASGLASVAPYDREAVRPAVADVVEVARSADPDERDEAVDALYRLSTPFPRAVLDGVDRLVEVAADPEVSPEVRLWAISAVLNVTDVADPGDFPVDPLVEVVEERTGLGDTAAAAIGDVAGEDPDRFEAAVDPLLEWTEETAPDREALLGVPYALGALEPVRPRAVRATVERLVETARSSDDAPARRATRELCVVADSAPELVADALEVDDPDDPDDGLGDRVEAAVCRASLAEEVPGYADPAVVETLHEYDGDDVVLQYGTALGLERIAARTGALPDRVVESMIDGLPEASASVTVPTLRALGHLGTARAREAVEAWTDAYDFQVREAAREAIETIEESDPDAGGDGAGDDTGGDGTGGDATADDGASDASGGDEDATPAAPDGESADAGADAGDSSDEDGELSADERRILDLLSEHHGQLVESRIAAETGWSIDRVADVTAPMAGDGRIDRVELGSDYVVSLPDGDEPRERGPTGSDDSGPVAGGDAHPSGRPDVADLAAAIGEAEPARLLAPVVERADDAGRVRTEAVVEEVGRDGRDALVEDGYLEESGDEAVVSLPAGIDFEFRG